MHHSGSRTRSAAAITSGASDREPQDSNVKRRPIILLIALISTARLAAQTTADFSSPASGVSTSRNNASLITQDPQLIRDDVIMGKKYTVSGLLVRPFKAIKLHKAGSGLAKLLQAINPFSREQGPVEDVRFAGELSTRAWSSSVGWHPATPAIPNAVTHEMGLTFISVGR